MADGTDCRRELLKDKCLFAWISPQAFCVFYDKLFIIKCIILIYLQRLITLEKFRKTAGETRREQLPRKIFFSLYILYIDFGKLLNKPKATGRVQFDTSQCSVSSWGMLSPESHSCLVRFRSAPSSTNWQMEKRRQPRWQAYSSSSWGGTRKGLQPSTPQIIVTKTFLVVVWLGVFILLPLHQRYNPAQGEKG